MRGLGVLCFFALCSLAMAGYDVKYEEFTAVPCSGTPAVTTVSASGPAGCRGAYYDACSSDGTTTTSYRCSDDTRCQQGCAVLAGTTANAPQGTCQSAGTSVFKLTCQVAAPQQAGAGLPSLAIMSLFSLAVGFVFANFY